MIKSKHKGKFFGTDQWKKGFVAKRIYFFFNLQRMQNYFAMSLGSFAGVEAVKTNLCIIRTLPSLNRNFFCEAEHYRFGPSVSGFENFSLFVDISQREVFF